ncbi:MAG: ABC transporter permease [Planctomycetales bacterium]|nr:ABC transporter permease [Planctomycetales bacterium]
MRPYLAVIKDSFREAIASRILWIMLLIIGLLLAGAAPFGLKKSLAYRVMRDELRRVDEFANRLTRSPALETDAAIRHVVSLMDMDKIDQPEVRRHNFLLRMQIAEQLTKAIENDDFYDEAAWKDVELKENAQELLNLGSRRSEEENLRFHRLALESIFKRYIQSARDDTISLNYAGRDIGLPALPAKQVRETIRDVLTGFVSFLAGSIGVFVAVLVTASVIPNTFDSGSVYLLLSKPISRPLLYISKFIGGCSFVIINASFLVVGVWLLAGVRLGEWNHRLLLCIPIFLFLFAVYYSVSGLAGLVWRNTIVCIGVTVMFWLACTVIGTTKQLVDVLVHEPSRVAAVTRTNAGLFAATNNGSLQVWNEDKSDWDEVVTVPPGPPGMFNQPLVPVVDDPKNNRTLLIKDRIQLTQYADGKTTVYEGFPTSVKKLTVDGDGSVLAIGSEVFRISDELVRQGPTEQPNIFGFKLPALPKTKKNFEQVVVTSGGDSFTEKVHLDLGDADVAINTTKKTLVAFDKGAIRVCRQTENGYEQSAQSQTVDEEEGLLATAGDYIVVALSSGAIQLISHDDLEAKSEFNPFGQNQPRAVYASADGRYFAVLFHSRQVWLYDAQDGRDLSGKVPRQKSISGFGIANAESGPTLLVVDRVNRVTEYSLPNVDRVSTKAAAGSFVQNLSWFAVDPLYKVFPQPTRLDETVSYLMTGKSAVSINGEQSLSRAQYTFDPWAPVWSSAIFMAVMVLAGCIYIYRQDY